MNTEFLCNFISKNKYAVFSTVTKDNLPEAALVGIAVTTNVQIIFDTVNPSIAFVIGWDNEQTLQQYEGIAKILIAAERDKLLEIYFKVFPDGKERKENWKDIAYFCVKPKWIRYSDFNNRQIEEFIFKEQPLIKK